MKYLAFVQSIRSINLFRLKISAEFSDLIPLQSPGGAKLVHDLLARILSRILSSYMKIVNFRCKEETGIFIMISSKVFEIKGEKP